MFDGLFLLLTLSVVMALASFLAGALPLSMTLSPSQLRLISTIGMGVLVGTSLIVIIPEGIEAVYTSGSETHLHTRRSLQLQSRSPAVRWPSTGVHTLLQRDTPLQRDAADVDAFTATPGPVIPVGNNIESSTASDDTAPPVAPSREENATPGSPSDEHHDDPPTFYIGLSLILGFILMYLIDALPRHASENLAPAPATRHISLDNLSLGLHPPVPSQGDEESDSFLQSLTPSPKQSRSLATTTGLVIHAAADGIAMGASASSKNASLGFVIFIAIMIHKAPAAFGLTSVLLKQGLSKRAARGHLVIFSLAAPVGALSTWLLVNVLGGAGQMEGERGQWWTGMLLLFSAGTFLYVAMHAMQEETHLEHPHSHSSHSASNGYAESTPSQRNKPKSTMRDTLAAVGGMLIPLLTQIGHHH